MNVAGGAASYTYDANGNLETKTEGSDVWVYEWNAMNQLVEVKKGTTVGNAASVATFKYDPVGRRIEKATPTKVTTYTYDGADILRENVTISGSTVTSYYVHGPGIDEPLSKETGGVLTYYHADGLGSIAKETNGSGVVTATLRYDAWGNIETGARDGFAFTGREWDPETGLYYYRARYYDAVTGRFISEDPIGLLGGINVFAYALQNPTRFRDSTGLKVDINLFNPQSGRRGDPYAKQVADHLQDQTDVLTIAGHGTKDGRIYGKDGSIMTPAELVEMIKGNADYARKLRQSKRVVLYVCWAGQRAQEYADAFGMNADGPSGLIEFRRFDWRGNGWQLAPINKLKFDPKIRTQFAVEDMGNTKWISKDPQ